MSNDFVHLHVHSEFSLLDGLSRIDKLVQRAQRLGQPALALTDHGTMHGVIPFFRTAKAAGIHPVVGVEAYLTRWTRPMEGRDAVQDKDRHHLLLLAQNQTGYRNLLKICSDAQTRGYYYRPRIDADYLASHSEGLICTTGCLAAEVPSLLNGEHGARPQEKLALERLQWYVDVFGKDRFYIEIQEHDIATLRTVNKTLLEWSKRHDIGLVVTNDVHYVEPEDARYHDVLLCVQTSSQVTQANRMRMTDNSYYLKSGEEMRAAFRPLVDLPDSAFTNTRRIAEMCHVDLEDKHLHLPDIDVPEGHDYQSYLRELTEQGLRWRYGSRADDEDVRIRTEHELHIIHQMGFDVYFLIVGDLCRYARGRDIWYNVRGSGAGSIVAYATGITGIDPLLNNLIFERFLNPSRITMPDFDLDFPDDQREEMIRYTIDKYGPNHVAQIVSFGRMKARAAVRDVARVMDVSLQEADRIAKMIPAIPGKPITIEQCLGKDEHKPDLVVPELASVYQSDSKVKELLDTASALEGVARHASTHAAAVIVTDEPLTHYLPVMRPQKAVITETVTQFEFPICESIGLLKVDFLGLSTLTVMREATKLIRERHGVTWTLDTIPLDDPASYTLLSSGEVSGVFQVEGAGLRRMLTEMQPSEFNHIVAAISLYRPGPMDFIPEYVDVMHGRKEAHYVHPALEPILSETYGVCVSGDAMIQDVLTGKRYRLDELKDIPDVVVQGVDDTWKPATGRIIRWIDSGIKPVYRVKLRNGAQIKVTADHLLLTEQGWQPLRDLQVGETVATPRDDVQISWNEIIAIEFVGEEHVYDLTVEGIHSFVADNVIVHNCVYQEQVMQLLTDIAGYSGGEADNVRRAISKKSEKTILQHREIFAKGAAEKSGLKRHESDAIWDALLGFARYGFNRSHAADYAVITVQTAYLKAKYPLEYMAALLYVERDNPEKVAFYITEARRMGIEVLPPDVNASSFNFTVEQGHVDSALIGRDLHMAYPFPIPPGAAIRYGLAAIKNVGEGPVEAILAARQENAFPSLEALCERTDLRKVGKKALECLIKVGALDGFGERGQLLEGIEQLLGVSRSRHEAAEVGQLSMFDLLDGAGSAGGNQFVQRLTLPTAEPLNPRQRLEMERELLGVYVSSHPLQQMAVDLSDIISCTCGELGDAQAGKSVVLAGNITRINPITTKKGGRMAFVTLEDLQGQCDIVVFPKTWEETKDLWVQDKIVLVRGKAEKRGESINVLCESVHDYITRHLAADDHDPYEALRQSNPVFSDGSHRGAPPAYAPTYGSGHRISEFSPEPSYGDADALVSDDDSSAAWLEEPEWLRAAPAAGSFSPAHASQPGQPNAISQPSQPSAASPMSLASPAAPASFGDAAAPAAPPRPAPQPALAAAPVRTRELRITLQRTVDAERDKRLLSWVVELLRAAPGPDRFFIVVRRNDAVYELEFPNDGTTITPVLEQQLIRRLGAGSVEVRQS